MTDEELKGALPDIPSALEIITTLRAQLAEATKLAAAGNLIALELRVTEGLVDEQRTRADRAEQRVATLEAALAAQIEADATYQSLEEKTK